jgi:glycosyltransferase involved in cell wall biosynthesis
MRVFVQIPCLNEEQTLSLVLDSIPKRIKNVDSIEVLIIDDGSTDKTVAVAKSHGVTHFVTHTHTMGLARSFHDGVDYALKNGADIVVNTDGDNQYPQKSISNLIQPILKGEADIVIGDRQTKDIAHFSLYKKMMQRFGSWVVNKAAGTTLPDAASGFRAYSRMSLYRINIMTDFSYAMETIIQAGNKRLKIISVPIKTNLKTRESRLFKNIGQHMRKSAQAILRSYVVYHPYAIFSSSGVFFFIIGSIPFIRFVILSLNGTSRGHLQSLVIGAALLTISVVSFALLIISDLLRTNRILIEDQLERIKEIQYKK